MACNPLTNLSRECGKTAAAGLRSEVYLVPFDSLVPVSGSTEVYAVSATGLVNQIGFSGSTKFVKYSSVKDQSTFSETYSYADNGSYNITKELTFTLSNVASTEGKKAVENLINNPVCALVKTKSGQWLLFGQNGLFSMSGSAGELNSSGNQRVITLSGSDTDFIYTVDPTVVSTFLAAA
jgi:hypothetical protein